MDQAHLQQAQRLSATQSYHTMHPAPPIDQEAEEEPAETPNTPETPDEYPDGGKAAWICVFGSFCSLFAALSMMNSVGVYRDYLSENQLKSSSPGRIGWIFGFYNFFSFFAGLPLGPVFDTYGPRHLSLCGGLLLVTTYIALANCSEYWHFFLTFGGLGSLATCLLFTPAVGSVQHWFLRRRGLATGMAISGGSVGGIVSPIIISALVPRIGFAWTMRAMALMMVPFVVVGTLLMRRRLISRGPSRLAFIPDLRILLKPRLSIMALGALFIELGLFIPLTYVASYAVSRGMSSHVAYRMITLLNVGSLLGRWLPGWLGDKIGRFNAQIIALALCLVSVLGIWLPAGPTVTGLTAFVLLFGLGSGSGISLVPVCIGQLCATEDYGKTFTAIYSIGSFG